MSEGERIPWAAGDDIARELRGLLLPACERIEIAGSIRRQCPDIGDIDLVCEPRIERVEHGLFGDEVTERDLLHALASVLVTQGTLEKRFDKNRRPSWGLSLKKARFRGIGVDIQSVTDPMTWGSWLLIRTGPAAFNKAIVTPEHQGGLLPSGFEWKNGFQLYRYGGRVVTPTEEAVFDALGLIYVEPAERAAPTRG